MKILLRISSIKRLEHVLGFESKAMREAQLVGINKEDERLCSGMWDREGLVEDEPHDPLQRVDGGTNPAPRPWARGRREDLSAQSNYWNVCLWSTGASASAVSAGPIA